LLILDEATADLDTVTERELMMAVRSLMRGRTKLVITQRLVEMDEILVLDEGRIVERGSHEDLARASGLYRRMLDVQRAVCWQRREVRKARTRQNVYAHGRPGSMAAWPESQPRRDIGRR
jgi:ABC-type transport system involved in cytochrome bd biosynthesis fused ATPase/permease subunit